MSFASLDAGALTKASSMDRWGFIEGAACRCGAPLAYKAANLRLRHDLPVRTVGAPVEVISRVRSGLVCDCGAVYTRGMNTR